MTIPLSTHLFLVAVPVLVSIVCIAVYLAGGRREQ